MISDYAKLDRWIDAHFAEETAFLQELVRVPTDTPPGDNAPHAARTADLLAGFGFIADRYAVPEAIVREQGLASITNLVVRRRYGDGPTIALNAHGDVVPPGEGWTPRSLRRRRSRPAGSTAAPRRSARATSPPTPSPCARSSRSACRSRAASSCTSPTTRSSAASSAPAGC